jgi:CheY-like chemotaxis protein
MKIRMPINPAAPVLLYVEDEVLIQATLVEALEDAGFTVLIANSGEDAIAVLASSHQSLHGLVTDVNLGKGADGWEVARTGRELVGGLPVVYVSGASEQDWTSRGVPASVMISKPFVPAQVVVAISSLLIVSE